MIWDYIKLVIGTLLIGVGGPIAMAALGIMVGDLILYEIHKNDDKEE